MVTACPRCHGRGTVVLEKCPDCRGEGRVGVKRLLTVKIPPGIREGLAVRVQGEGEPPSPDVNPSGSGIRGDLHVVCRVREHKMFERDGDHLLLVAPIAFTQAALGADIQVPTLEGSTTLKIPAGTQHGTMFRVPGLGMPNLRSGKRGDIVVIAQLVVPRKLSDDQEQLLAEYARTENLEVITERPSLWDKIKDAVSPG
jgi:molecular chaperone DnaJ